MTRTQTKGRGTQVRTLKGRTDIETQVTKSQGDKKGRKIEIGSKTENTRDER